MNIRALQLGLLISGALLAGSIGCQWHKQPPGSPAALPAAMSTATTPRLNAATYFAHAHLLERQGELNEAVVQYRKALELSPHFVSARNRLGITLNKLGRHAEATAELRLALQDDPTQAYLHNNLGFSLFLEGQLAEADEALQRAIALKPEFGRAHMNRGMVLGNLGRYDEARVEFALVSGEADAYYNIGLIQIDAGDLAGAARSLEAALRLEPRLEAAREQLRLVARLAAEAEALDQGAEPAEPPLSIAQAQQEPVAFADRVPPTPPEAGPAPQPPAPPAPSRPPPAPAPRTASGDQVTSPGVTIRNLPPQAGPAEPDEPAEMSQVVPAAPPAPPASTGQPGSSASRPPDAADPPLAELVQQTLRRLELMHYQAFEAALMRPLPLPPHY